MSSLVVKNHRPWQFAVAIVVLSMFLASLTWLLLDKGHWALIYERIGDNNEWKNLWEVNQSLEEERVALQERVLMLERITSVDKQTTAILQDEIKSLQESLYKMTGELEFYEGIMDATRGAKGLNIHGIYIEPLLQSGTYRLKLVLTHVAKGSIEATGTMKISVIGKLNESEQELEIEELAIGENVDLSYKLRSFKRFQVKLALPDKFVADTVVIELQPKSRNKAIIKEVFDWTAPAS